MPINPSVLQRRHAEIGRIRLGEKGAKGQPVKLTTFRFTSASRDLIEAVAALYGGTAKAWDNSGKPEWEVVSEATSVPVIVVKGGLSQWLETWSGGGCIHRCDGEHNVLTDQPCDLTEMVRIGRDTVNPHAAAKPYTRLSVMLRDVETLGVWRMESHGWNAAAEIPAMAELAMFVGDLVPAVLHLVERRAVKDGRTSRFVVPVLDLQVSKARLVEIASGQAGAPAIAAGPSAPVATAIASAPAPEPVDWLALAAGAQSEDECRAVWLQARDADALTDAVKAAITARLEEVRPAAPADPGGPTAPSAGVDAAWLALVAAAGTAGLTEPDLRAGLEQRFAQPVEDLTAEQLTEATLALHEAGAL